MSVLELKDVTYRYESSQHDVLNKLNASFEKGKVYCIVGKSGAGKTTLLSLLSGLDICSEGEITYNQESLKQMDRNRYRAEHIGVIFQSYNLLLNATAIENIMLSMHISHVATENYKTRAYEILETLGIDHTMANRKILKLSGGEQQRVGIARAISHNADIIIADEPTGNLDPDNEEIIMSILCNLAHRENKCIIVVTHSRSVSAFADEIWGLNQGKLVYVNREENNSL